MTIILIITLVTVLLAVSAVVSASWRQALIRWIGGKGAVVLSVAALVTLIGIIGYARTGSDDASTSVAELGLIVAFAVLFAFALLSLSVNLAGFDPDANDFASSAASGELGERLLLRWLHRVRWRRWVGGFVGLLSGFSVVSLIESSDLGSGAFVYPGLLGVTLGSISAEFHHLRSAKKGTRVADLTVRTMADFTDPTDQKALGICGAASAITLGYALASPASTGWAAAAGGIVLVALGLQYRVALRRRPALTQDLREADDLLRTIAVSRGVARPAIALCLATVGMALAPSNTTGAETAEAVAWIGALVFWWRNRGLGLNSIRIPRHSSAGTKIAPSTA